MESIETKILHFISEQTQSETEITRTTSLFKGGVLSSLDLVALLAFLEDEFKIKIPSAEIDFSNFDSVERMAAFVQKQQTTH